MSNRWEAFSVHQLSLNVNSLDTARLCEGEVIVKGDEGPVRGVAQVVDCHGVTVGHEEREEEVEERQEVESDGEKTLKERYERQVRAA